MIEKHPIRAVVMLSKEQEKLIQNAMVKKGYKSRSDFMRDASMKMALEEVTK